METHDVVSREEWLVARKAHLQNEKALTKARDALSRERRALPWVRIDEVYRFEGPDGEETLADLFQGRSQLIVQHFMFGPDWEQGCVGCSFQADHVDGARVHLEQHDVSFAAVSRAPWPKIEAFRRRMGWRFKWVSSHASRFNQDFHVSFGEEERAAGKVDYNYRVGPFESDEMSGTSVFFKDAAGDIFHTYSSFARGDEPLIGTYSYLDLTPKGRNETGPGFDLTDWVRHHDRYGSGADAGGGCQKA